MDRDTRPDFASTVMIPSIQEFIKNPNDVAGLTKKIEDRRKRDNDGKKEIQNEGDVVERKVLNPWESYIHALLFANEGAYVN